MSDLSAGFIHTILQIEAKPLDELSPPQRTRTTRQCCALNGVLARQGCVGETGKTSTTLVVERGVGSLRKVRLQAVQAARGGHRADGCGVMRQPRSGAMACSRLTSHVLNASAIPDIRPLAANNDKHRLHSRGIRSNRGARGLP
ncbi:hypothetical protein [Burkholderia sp. WP9]|jgi:hypothetical protein|uniref:hypothetical protein n=1 Tax=Burkholderia sp. WP9 TaxID=1500263 RepID=UPI00115FC8DA|nr:hypothetical protein [Burkholderia sp. WP9]